MHGNGLRICYAHQLCILSVSGPFSAFQHNLSSKALRTRSTVLILISTRSCRSMKPKHEYLLDPWVHKSLSDCRSLLAVGVLQRQYLYTSNEAYESSGVQQRASVRTASDHLYDHKHVRSELKPRDVYFHSSCCRETTET